MLRYFALTMFSPFGDNRSVFSRTIDSILAKSAQAEALSMAGWILAILGAAMVLVQFTLGSRQVEQ